MSVFVNPSRFSVVHHANWPKLENCLKMDIFYQFERSKGNNTLYIWCRDVSWKFGPKKNFWNFFCYVYHGKYLMTSWYWLYVLCILFFDFDVSVLMWCELQLHSQVCDVTATATLLYTTGPRAGTSILSGDKNTEQISLKFWNFLSPIIPRRTCKNGE